MEVDEGARSSQDQLTKKRTNEKAGRADSAAFISG
jgi:hypothetical protein